MSLKLKLTNQRGSLTSHLYSGTWGNRGQGNELQSALENGLSWIGDKIVNADDYIEQGLALIIGLMPGKMSQQDYLENVKRKQQAIKSGNLGYVNTNGDVTILPMTGMPPTLPTLPTGASSRTIELHNKLGKAWKSWSARESLLKKVGLLDKLEKTKTVANYRNLERQFQESLIPQTHKKYINENPLTRKGTSEFKSNKRFSMNDGRATNQGRPRVRERQYDAVEEMMRKDPKAEGLLHKYDLKVAKGLDSSALRKARIDMIQQYLKVNPGYFTWLLK